jgi:hypothetical protein
MTDRNWASLRALAALDPRTDRDAAEAALADPSVAAAFVRRVYEVPEWVVSPRLLLDVTAMDVVQCARLLAHPAITPAGVEYIAERMNGSAASALAGRRDTPAGILEVLARKRSDEPTLIAIAGNPQRTTATLKALVAGTNESVVQGAIVDLLQELAPCQVALIITALAPESLTLAIASLPTSAALSLAADSGVSVQILRALAEIHPDREVQTAVVSNGATTPELLAVIAKSGGSPEVRALVALDPRTDRTTAKTALTDPRVSAAVTTVKESKRISSPMDALGLVKSGDAQIDVPLPEGSLKDVFGLTSKMTSMVKIRPGTTAHLRLKIDQGKIDFAQSKVELSPALDGPAHVNIQGLKFNSKGQFVVDVQPAIPDPVIGTPLPADLESFAQGLMSTEKLPWSWGI